MLLMVLNLLMMMLNLLLMMTMMMVLLVMMNGIVSSLWCLSRSKELEYIVPI